MKKLTLIRHAKSSWKHPGLADYDRPLNKRGRNDAPVMGKRLAESGFSPQRIISSPALRALRTAEAVVAAAQLPYSCIDVDPRIYHADEEGLITLIQHFCPDVEWMAVVGHNPEMTSLVSRLSGTFIANIPTCGVAELHFELNGWDRLGSSGEKPCFFHFDYPKNVPP